MGAAAYTRKEILEQLDDCARALTFPVLDAVGSSLVDSRLHAFRDSKRWAIAFEVLGWWPKRGRLINHVTIFSSTPGRPLLRPDMFEVTPVDEDIEDPRHPGLTKAGLHAIKVRGSTVRLPGNADERRPLLDMFRTLMPRHDQRFLATDAELAEALPDGIAHMLRLRKWRHPDVVRGELPSDTVTFKTMADALASGNVNRFCNTEEPNNHWSHWEDSGWF